MDIKIYDTYCHACENQDVRCEFCGMCEICDVDLHAEDCVYLSELENNARILAHMLENGVSVDDIDRSIPFSL